MEYSSAKNPIDTDARTNPHVAAAQKYMSGEQVTQRDLSSLERTYEKRSSDHKTNSRDSK